jgi:CheY-like chemotaxis protein
MERPVVLVVDDHPVNVKLVSVVLRARGVDVLSAGSAEEMWTALEKGAPALILMDVQLPGTDGLTLTREVLADPRFHALPIVALTAHAMASDEAAARAAGCCDYVSKPIDTRALGDLVTRLVRH